MQVQVLPVATATMLVCRYVVKYHGEFTIAALHHYSCFASMTLPYLMYFIKPALEFGKVKIKLLEMTFKGKQSIFPHQQPLHCLVLTFTASHTWNV